MCGGQHIIWTLAWHSETTNVTETGSWILLRNIKCAAAQEVFGRDVQAGGLCLSQSIGNKKVGTLLISHFLLIAHANLNLRMCLQTLVSLNCGWDIALHVSTEEFPDDLVRNGGKWTGSGSWTNLQEWPANLAYHVVNGDTLSKTEAEMPQFRHGFIFTRYCKCPLE